MILPARFQLSFTDPFPLILRRVMPPLPKSQADIWIEEEFKILLEKRKGIVTPVKVHTFATPKAPVKKWAGGDPYQNGVGIPLPIWNDPGSTPRASGHYIATRNPASGTAKSGKWHRFWNGFYWSQAYHEEMSVEDKRRKMDSRGADQHVFWREP